MTRKLKENAARAAMEYVSDGMILGLGTGSTAELFVDLVGEKVRSGWDISGIPTSEATRQQATALGIELIEPQEATKIDLAVDGADEIDAQGNLIKGGGAALLREKIIASSAEKFVVIADQTKDVPQLGKFPLPVEVEKFGWGLSIRAIREVLSAAGYENTPIQLRNMGGDGFVMSDGGNYIVDVSLERITDAGNLDKALTMIPGVVTTGLFVGMSPTILLGTDYGVTRR